MVTLTNVMDDCFAMLQNDKIQGKSIHNLTKSNCGTEMPKVRMNGFDPVAKSFAGYPLTGTQIRKIASRITALVSHGQTTRIFG